MTIAQISDRDGHVICPACQHPNEADTIRRCRKCDREFTTEERERYWAECANRLVPSVSEIEGVITCRTITQNEEWSHPILALENAGKFPRISFWSSPTPEQAEIAKRSALTFKVALREAMLTHYERVSVEGAKMFELAWKYGYPRGVRGVVQCFEDFLQICSPPATSLGTDP